MTDAQSVSGKTYADALPGQYMDLEVDHKASAGLEAASYKWTLDDTNFLDWKPVVTTTSSSATRHDITDLTHQSIHFYWANSGVHMATVKVTWNDGSTSSGSARFTIAAPDVTFTATLGAVASATDAGHGTVRHPSLGLYAVGGTPAGYPNVGGNPSDDGTEVRLGIVFTGQIKMPAGWPATSGKWNFVQLVTQDSYLEKKCRIIVGVVQGEMEKNYWMEIILSIRSHQPPPPDRQALGLVGSL